MILPRDEEPIQRAFDHENPWSPSSADPGMPAPVLDLPPGAVILCDQNEMLAQHRGYRFEPSRTARLAAGDYSIEVNGTSLEKVVAVERKSLPNILGDAGGGRPRWERALEKLAKTVLSPHVVIEATWDRMRAGGWSRSDLHPNALCGGIIAWSTRFRVPFWTCATRIEAEFLTRWILARAAHDFLRRKSPLAASEEKPSPANRS